MLVGEWNDSDLNGQPNSRELSSFEFILGGID
jgi:hypothetical protein